MCSPASVSTAGLYSHYLLKCALLQAADFLNDAETLQRASRDLAMLAFPFNQPGNTDGPGGQGEPGVRGSNLMAPGDLHVRMSFPATP